MRYNLISRLPHIALVAATYIFLYVPIFVLVIFSFNKDPFHSPWTGFTLHWYRELWIYTELRNDFKSS